MKKQIKESQDQLKRLISYLEHTPENLDLLLDAISLAIDIQDWDTTANLLKQALLHHSENPQLNVHAGFFELRANNTEKAIEHFSFAIDNGIEDEALYYNLAYTQFLTRKFSDALNTLDSAKEINLFEKEITLLKARIFHNIDQLEEAEILLTNFIQENDQTQKEESLLSLILYDNDKITESIKYADTALSKQDNLFEALLARGSSNINLQRYEEALPDLEKAATLSPNNGRAHSGIGQIAFHNFEFDKALEQLETAVRTMPDHIGTLHILGWTYLMKERLEDARLTFEKSLPLDRSFGETHGCLATVYAFSGDTAKAEKHIKLAKKLGPNSFSYIYAKMVLLDKSGNKEQANTLFEKAKATYSEQLGTTPGELIEKRLSELRRKNQNSTTIH